jgi:hypothetical membrane protein
MESMQRYFAGEFDDGEIRWYVGIQSCLFWGLILLARLSYPTEHQYSIMTHTFSFMGSFEDKHNPQYWWIFTIAMLCWGVGSVPVVRYIHQRFVMISDLGAHIGAFFLFLGCLGIALVAIFPDVHKPLIGNLQWTTVHGKVALMAAGGFTLGIIWHGLLLLKDRFGGSDSKYSLEFNHNLLLLPYIFWGAISGTGIYFQIAWESVYAKMKADAAVTGQEIASHWGAALNTKYSFPFWENIVIYTLFIFLVWFTLSLPESATPKAFANSRSR